MSTFTLAFPQPQIRVASYNLLNYPADAGERNPHFRLILESLAPGLLVTQEMDDGGADAFLDSVLNYNDDVYSLGEFIDGPDTDNALYYVDSLFTFISNTPIRTRLRDVNQFVVRFDATGDTLILYSVHLKASPGAENEERRAAEVDSLRRVTNALPPGTNFIVCGDFNVYHSDEPAYRRLLEVEDDVGGQVLDPIDQPGDWHDNENFALIHTQSTRTRQFGGGARGGLDDRFDMILIAQAVSDSGGVTFEADSYVVFGNDGFHFNDSINARPNRAVEHEIADALHYASDHLPVMIELEFQVGAEAIQFSIPLRNGWNLLSSPVPPPDPAMITVWQEIVAHGNLFLVKDHAGNFYIPALDFNNLGDWDVRYGYYAKLNSADTLHIVNNPVAIATPIPLDDGWSFVSYLPDVSVDAPDAFANIEDMLLFVKDDRGRFYSPNYGFSNMGMLHRGKGYHVKVAEAVDLVWNVDGNAHANYGDDVDGGHFQPPANTGRNMSVLLNAEFRMQNAELEKTLEVGAFSATGQCVGISSFRIQHSSFRIGLAVWGDDPTTEEIDGALEGGLLTFELWDGAQGHVVTPDWREGDGVYLTDGFASGALDLSSFIPHPSSLILSDPYPNPFNSVVTLVYRLPRASMVRLAVADLAGREVVELQNGWAEAGLHRATWAAGDLPSGLYIVRLEAEGMVRSRKLTLMK